MLDTPGIEVRISVRRANTTSSANPLPIAASTAARCRSIWDGPYGQRRAAPAAQALRVSGVRDMLACASNYPLETAYPMYSWVLSNVMDKYANTPQAAQYVRDLFEGIARGASFFFMVSGSAGRLESNPKWRHRDGQEIHAVIRTGWSEPRRRVWETLHALRCASDFEEANALMHQLDEISTVIRAPGVPLFSPMEIAWQVTTAAGAGALTAWMASGNALLGAAVPAAGRAVAALGSLGYRLFGLGGFGLARSIRRAVRDYKPSVDQLGTLLSDREKRHLDL